MWLVGEGGIYGCGFKEVHRFPHTTYPYSSCICSFLQQHPYFLFIELIFFYNYMEITLNKIQFIEYHRVGRLYK